MRIDHVTIAGQSLRQLDARFAAYGFGVVYGGVHSTGLTQSKSEWIEGLRRLVGQRRRVVSGLIAGQHGDTAIVTGDLDVVWNDGRLALDRYVRVYQREAGNWRAIFQRTFTAHDRKDAAH